jgi:hypothetical protein
MRVACYVDALTGAASSRSATAVRRGHVGRRVVQVDAGDGEHLSLNQTSNGSRDPTKLVSA